VANAYNSLWQVRNDSWCSLEEAAAQLALAGAQQRPVEALSETVHGLLDVLGPIERFWAFPGPHSFQKVRDRRGEQPPGRDPADGARGDHQPGHEQQAEEEDRGAPQHVGVTAGRQGQPHHREPQVGTPYSSVNTAAPAA